MGTKARTERLMKLWSAAGGTRKEGLRDGVLAGGSTVAVGPGAGQEEGEGDRHGSTRQPKSESPADVVLDVRHQQHRGRRAAADPEVEPVEEGAPGPALFWVVAVELVDPKGLRAGLVAGLRDSHQVQCGEEEGSLELGGEAALPAAAAAAALRAGTNQDVKKGGYDGGAVAPEEVVADESAEEGEHQGHPAPRIHVGGGGGVDSRKSFVR
ncbi:unnamed protein product [Spirodela intermedia]|uniref:Uncharacterized protein n=1 Tax=Spirodela intermedia TaxID=51605 RepID=A0ABN7E916_SPIIN|nr:unnamed protein product [Spirodela intermedia]